MSTKTKNQSAEGIGLVQRLINKLGGTDKLDPEEKAAIDEYYDVFNRELTTEDLQNFLKNEIYNLHVQLRQSVVEGKDREALFISARIENYQVWSDYMEAPEREKEALIEHITSTINTTS